MSILEDFVIDLLRQNIIQNYTAKKKDVQDFYIREYESETGCSFYDFFGDLWYYWYVNRISKKTVHFDERWINYFKKQETQQLPKKEEFKENRYVTESKCLLCGAHFRDQDAYKEHVECPKHKIRVQYVKDKKIFTHSDDIRLEIAEINNTIIKKPTSSLEIEPKTNVIATLNVTNTSTSEMKIDDIIQVNPLTDIGLHENFEKEIILKPLDKARIVLNGYFENSASFTFPIVIVTQKGASAKKYILKEIPVEVTSEFSELKPEGTYVWKRVKNVPTLELGESIIPGKSPDLYTSHYKEVMPLKPFKIHPSFEKTLVDLISLCPSFITKGLQVADRFMNKNFCSMLQIQPGIDEYNYCTNLLQLLDIEEYQMRVDMRDYDMVSSLRKVKGSSLYELEVPGLAEARPSLLVYDSVYIKVNKQDPFKFQGIIHKVLETSIYFGMNHRFSDSFIEKRKYHIEFGFNRRSIRVEKQALHLANDHQIIPYFYPEKHNLPTIMPGSEKEINFYNRDLNDEQKAAVRNILMPKPVPYLIFGPPGTGKTVTVVESVLQIWKNEPHARVLVCAPSNAAVNEVAHRLVDTIPRMDIFRLLGSVFGNSPAEKKKMDRLQPIMNIQTDGTFYMPSMEDLLKYRVLLTTIVTAAKLVNGGVPEHHFSYVFIDESGYASETQTLIPIAGILSNAQMKGKIQGKIILAGDPKQLGQLVHSNFAKYCGYGKSMIERLVDTCEMYKKGEDQQYDQRFITKLVKNYRSHEAILHIPNRLFYDNELVAAGNQSTVLFVGSEHLKNKKFPIIFHHVEGEDAREKDSPSFFNIQEIEEVVGYLSKLLGSRVSGMQITNDHIGIVTPYKKQAQKLRTACEKKRWSNLFIGSVEQFQGKEKLIIIISTVRSKNANKFEEIDKVCHLGFLKNPKRFNVALTRAQALLIVIGNAHVLKTDKNWSSFIEYCVDNESVAGKRFSVDDREE